jgi:prepilin-type N-terminal cleavage/methylation domain-containing protein
MIRPRGSTDAGSAGPRYQSRRGMTLVELLIALVVLSILGASMVRLMTSQLRFVDQQVATKDAREVSRSALNALMSDIRMVDADSGILVATADSFTVFTPFASGIICGPTAAGTGTVIALLPYDSVSYTEGGYAGYAYIDTTTTGTLFSEVYQYKLNASLPTVIDSATAATSAPCHTATDHVGIFHPGAVVVQPAAPAHARYHSAMLLRKVTYAFRTSVSVPGKRGLFRTIVNGPRGTEEMVAPFDTSAGFSYYLKNGTKVTSAVGPSLQTIRGIELRVNGVSERVVQGATTPVSAPITTAVFFKNRPVQ